MDDMGLPAGWHDLDDWVRREREAEVPKGFGLCSSLAISFVDDRPDIVVETPSACDEEVDDVVAGLIELFGLLRPERLAVIWPNIFDLGDGDQVFAVRLNLAESDGAGRWGWTTRIHPYVLDAADRTRVAEWGPAFELVAPPDPGSQRLRTMFKASTHRRLLRRGWLKTPPRDNWDMAHHPESTTMEAFARTGYFIPAD